MLRADNYGGSADDGEETFGNSGDRITTRDYQKKMEHTCNIDPDSFHSYVWFGESPCQASLHAHDYQLVRSKRPVTVLSQPCR
jgi:hypothetical protein